ncbi:intradiol ring-cleavage dioxygenase [Pseudoduganella chitinolytica]|uniref:Intradiol ring-cleavage dioxygenase n=1 Tax=Pseudoduganella chitinolytica TaxID=34070 RepID=A0ABY8BG89_9BURK|nr:intradiol ring-cleavage dioxygenase [Pseudoduganella chitinolytica]WEF34706.1 intradiol ring-cleavage dioxygenase [Pseudoduganella chitinolytica]
MEYHDHGLEHDLQAMLDTAAGRRRSLRWLFAGAAALPLLGCGGSADTDSSTATTGTDSTSTTAPATTTPSTTTTTGSCAVIPEETGGPYPADGTNSNSGGVVNVLTQGGVVRSDIRASFGAASGTAAGVPLTVKLRIVNANNACAAAGNFAVYLWHCDRDGNYSLYSAGVTNQNYLRGVQEADANGDIAFTTIFPGCYAGRMPHIHFEVYPTLAKAASAANRIKTSQFTFPLATCNEVYATSGYSASVRNLAQMSFATDNVFSDGYALQLATLSGNPTDGYVATLTVAIVA